METKTNSIDIKNVLEIFKNYTLVHVVDYKQLISCQAEMQAKYANMKAEFDAKMVNKDTEYNKLLARKNELYDENLNLNATIVSLKQRISDLNTRVEKFSKPKKHWRLF